VRESLFWTLLADEFGPAYAASVAADHVLTGLGGRTAREALAAGVAPRTIWLALCEDYDVPESRRFGKDHPGHGNPS
jgi:hypothetical protein